MDAISFKKQYLPYQQKLYRIAYRLLEDGDDAEDMVQEAYIKLWNKKEELFRVENPESYSVIILRNLCLDFIKTKARHKTNSMEAIEYNLSEDTLLTQQLEEREKVKIIEKIVDQLPEQQRIVMKMRHIDDCSPDEIESITGLSNVNIRVLLSRARKKVKEIFEKEYNDEK